MKARKQGKIGPAGTWQ